MPNEFQYDVFLSHSAKDKAVVRPLAERLRQDGPFEFGTRNSELGIAQPGMSANAFGSDWAQVLIGPQLSTSSSQPTAAPLNNERRFSAIPHSALTFPHSFGAPIKGSDRFRKNDEEQLQSDVPAAPPIFGVSSLTVLNESAT